MISYSVPIDIVPTSPFPEFNTYWDFAVLLVFKQVCK